MLDSLFVVIVIYGIELDQSSTYLSLLQSSIEIGKPIDLMIYDNSKKITTNVYSPLNFNINYISDPSNPGLSKPYNLAAENANKLDKKWLLILDQDSILPKDYFTLLNNTISENPTEVLIAPILKQRDMILSPCKFKYMKGSNFPILKPGIYSFKDISIFNSGLVINLKAFNKVGGYDEDIPLDFSDHYFIAKLKTNYKQFLIAPIIIEHELSSHTSKEKLKIAARYQQYCIGVNAYMKKVKGSGLLRFWTLLRGVKLTYQFRDFRFLTIFLKNNYNE